MTSIERTDQTWKPSRYRRVDHIWLGTSVESGRVDHRIDELRQAPAKIRFLSCEPLVGPIPNLTLDGIHWVIVAGESGNHLWQERTRERRAPVGYVDGEWRPREERKDWVRAIQRRCAEDNVPFFFKQWGGATPKAAGRELDGRTWEEFPTQNPETLQAAGE
jgi:protein gp37